MAEENKAQTEGKKWRQDRKHRTSDQVMTDYHLIVGWRATNPPMDWRDIAKKLSELHGRHISHQAVWAVWWRITGRLTDEAREKAIQDHQATLLWMAEELIEAWKGSQGKIVKRTVKSKPGKPDGDDEKSSKLMELQVTEEISHGDVAYINALKGVLERHAKLIGADAPIKIAKTDTDGNDIPEQPAIVVLPSNGRGVTPMPETKPVKPQTKKKK